LISADGEAVSVVSAVPAVSTDPTAPRTIVELLERSAAVSGDRIAIVDGDVRCTYDELRRRARRAADGFIAQGVRKGDRVALWLPNRLEWAVSFFGAIYAGAVVVTLNTALSVSEIEYQVGHSGASVLVVCAAYRNRDYRAEARQVMAARGGRLVVVVVDDAAAAGGAPGGAGGDPGEDVVAFADLLRAPAQAQLPPVAEADPAIMLYTSGTTGRPKGAVHTHRFLSTLHSAAGELEFSADDCLVLYLPLFHILALVGGLIMLTLVGARVVLMARFDATESLRLMQRERATLLYGIPTTYIDQLNSPAIDHTDFSAVRFAWASLAPDLSERVRAKLGVACLNPYGMTETAACVTFPRLGDPPDVAIRTVGRPLGQMEAKVVDETTGRPVPRGAVGALVMRGPSIMWKYHDQPDATARAFDSDGWFRTGDLASIDGEGNVTFLGRRGDTYRVGGEMVDPVEVEAALQSHPAVIRAAALGVADDRLGEVGYAWAQLHAGSEVTPEELRAHAAGLLASFKVPREIHITGELPTTPSGKVQKFRLRETIARLPDTAKPRVRSE
jgi:acyl-CoA synthetase (AMP-forming)/AMP-acid ligase II